MLNLENFGKMIMKEEFVVNTKTHEVIDGLYLGEDEIYHNGIIGLDITYMGKLTYKTIISKINKDEDSIQDKEIFTAKINNLRSLLAAEDALTDEGFEAPSLYTWENSNNKDEEFFTFRFNGIDLNCPKEHNLLVDKFVLLEFQKQESFADQIINSKISEFHNHNYGLMLNRNDIFELQYYLNDESRLENGVNAIVTGQYVKNPNISLDLPNLSIMVENILFYNDDKKVAEVELRYDDDGLVKGGSSCLYESYTIDGFNKPVFSSSLHPFYFDTFDTGLIGYNGNRFCIDQINRYLDDDLLEYTREVYEIDSDKKQDLLEEIKKAQESKEHVIPTI